MSTPGARESRALRRMLYVTNLSIKVSRLWTGNFEKPCISSE